MAREDRPPPDNPTVPTMGDRLVLDWLPAVFTLERSESEWLMTLLSAADLRYIFEGTSDGEGED